MFRDFIKNENLKENDTLLTIGNKRGLHNEEPLSSRREKLDWKLIYLENENGNVKEDWKKVCLQVFHIIYLCFYITALKIYLFQSVLIYCI